MTREFMQLTECRQNKPGMRRGHGYLAGIVAGLLTVGIPALSMLPVAHAAPPSGKSLYSSRPVPTRVAPRSLVIVEDDPIVPIMPDSQADAPRLAPNTLVAPGRPQTQPSGQEDAVLPILPADPNHDRGIWLDDSMDRPLSGIDVPTKRKPLIPLTDTEQPVLRFDQTGPTAKADEASSIDDFHARLAKIQLEKHHLDETLDLIEKIKSPAFKVKTLVDLAEYVSRDSNYRREAETLYDLAVNGIEALTANKPIVVKRTGADAFLPRSSGESTTGTTSLPKLVDEVKPTIKKPTLTLLEEEPATPTIPETPAAPATPDPTEQTPTPLPRPAQVDKKPETPKTETAPVDTALIPFDTAPKTESPKTEPPKVEKKEEKPAAIKPVEEKKAEKTPEPEKKAESSTEEAKPVRRPLPKRQIILQEE